MKRAVRAAASITAAIAIVGVSPAPALAAPPAPFPQQPPPETASEALEQYEKLTSKVEKVNEDLNQAKDKLGQKKKQLADAKKELAEANKLLKEAEADEEEFRDEVDELTHASFQGARFNKLSALLTGSSADDFLERASALGVLASDSEEALSKLTRAVNQASDAKQKASDAKSKAADATQKAREYTNKIRKTKANLDEQIAEVEAAYEELSGAEQDHLGGGGGYDGVFVGGPGAAGKAAEMAMSRLGDPYVWGGTSPGGFDCSGLTYWAYAQAGVSLPRSSREQYNVGVPVEYGQWKIGDLLFYGSSPGSIHHVAMYIGGGQLVHASTYGVPVGVADAPHGGGGDYLAAKRVAG